MKRKLVVIFVVFLLGALALLLGSFFKIQHWSGSGELLLAGFGAQLVSCLALVVVLIQRLLLKR